jgi:LCP family protein required for cell wall assembly
MTDARDELLIRQALADEAGNAAEPGIVLAALRQGRQRRRRPGPVAAVAGLAVVAGVVAVVVPLTASRGNGPGPGTGAVVAGVEQNILLVGVDEFRYTDAIVLVRLGADGALRAISLPRDSQVDIPGSGPGRLSSAYAQAAATDAGNPDAAGMTALVRTVQTLTGVTIDHFASMRMAGLAELNEAVGGVEICLRSPASDPLSGAHLPAGRQRLTGDQALAFLRQRHGLPNGDLDRIVRQQAFLRSLSAKLSHGEILTNPTTLERLLSTVRENVRVDPGWDLPAAARELAAASTVDIVTIPHGVDTSAGMLEIDPAAVRAFTTQFLSGKATGAPAPPSAPTSPLPNGETCVN